MTNGNSEEVKKQVAYLDFKIGQQEDEWGAVSGSGSGAGAEKEGKSNRNSGGLKRVTIELATEALPLTCQNFMALCEEKDANESEISHSYQNSKVFKIEPKVGICLGDIISSTGLSGSCHPSTSASATTATKTNTSPNTFSHESTVLSHAEKGMVSMLHSGRDRNDSRFVITTKNAPHLDGKYVAFGRVKEGLDFLEDIVKNVYTRKGRPTVDIEVVKCGILQRVEQYAGIQSRVYNRIMVLVLVLVLELVFITVVILLDEIYSCADTWNELSWSIIEY